MKQESIEFNSLGATLQGFVRVPEGSGPFPGVVMCHGLTNSKTADPLIEDCAHSLVHAGFVTLQFDFFGSGDSPGLLKQKRISSLDKNVQDAIGFFLTMSVVDRKRIGLWGRSIGATLAFLNADHPSVRGCFLASPTVNFQGFFNRLIPPERPSLIQMPSTIQHGPIKGEWALELGFFEELPALDERIKRDATRMKNICIVQGTSDSKSPVNDSNWFFELLPQPKKMITLDTDHDYSRGKEHALDAMIEWFASFLYQ